MKTVLLIAGLSEWYYYEPFIAPVRQKGMRICVFDPAAVPRSLTVSLQLDVEQGVWGQFDAYELTPEPTRISLQLAEIDVAWYLRLGVRPSLDDLSTVERFRQNESRATVETLLSVLPTRWVNEQAAMVKLTSNKFYQQRVAMQSGLTVPATCVGNDPAAILDRSEVHDGLLLKSLGYTKIDEDDRYFLYANRFSHAELSESERSMRSCPVFAQQYVPKRYEHRVMVIGDEVLSCRIDSQASKSEKTRTDWRHYDLANVEHTAVSLPVEVADCLREFMRRVDLRYGAIDLIETPAGEFVFLEVNPAGQWGWIHDLAGLPIPDAVASMLEKM